MRLFLSILGADIHRLALTDDPEYGLRSWAPEHARALFDLITNPDTSVQGWRSVFQSGGIRQIFDLAKGQGADVTPRTIFQAYNLAEMIQRSTNRSYSLVELVQANGRLPAPSDDPAVDELRQLQLVLGIFAEDLPLILPARPQLGETTSLRFWQNGAFEPGSLHRG